MAHRKNEATSSGTGAGTRTAAVEEVIAWFSKFRPFVFDTTANLKANFECLAKQRQWGDKLKHKRWIECQTALFGALYGNDADVTKLEKWQDLCRAVRIEEIPVSIKKCKAALGKRNVLVNLVNLIDHRLSGVPLIRFETYGKFQAYTKNGRVYPLKAAKEEGFIRALLRKVY